MNPGLLSKVNSRKPLDVDTKIALLKRVCRPNYGEWCKWVYPENHPAIKYYDFANAEYEKKYILQKEFAVLLSKTPKDSVDFEEKLDRLIRRWYATENPQWMAKRPIEVLAIFISGCNVHPDWNK